MLYKYLGEDKSTNEIRISFLSDGLFRFTQPQYLDDETEGKANFFINEYSPKDILLAKKYLSNNYEIFFNNIISDETAIKQILNPFPPRRIDAFPPVLKSKGFKSIEEFDETELEKFYSIFEDQLNEEVGVFSMSTDNKKQSMWGRYASEYNGIIIGFDKKKLLSQNYISGPITYDLDKKGFEVSLNKGMIRFNGMTIDKMPKGKFKLTEQLLKSFLFHKDSEWEHQSEFRLLSYFKNASKKHGDIYLEKIPFEIFKEVYIGSKVFPDDKVNIIKAIKNNHELSHVKVYKQTSTKLTGKIIFELINSL